VNWQGSNEIDYIEQQMNFVRLIGNLPDSMIAKNKNQEYFHGYM
jgi:hypothetical protein